MKKKTKGLWIAWLLVLPVVIVRAFTTLYPIIMTFINSTYDMSLLKGNNFQFIGLENYLRIFEDQKLLSSIGFTVKFTVVSMFFHLVLGVILALMLNMKIKGKKFLRTIVLIPWAMPMVVAGLAARWAFNDQYGLINDLIRRFVPNFHYDWLVHANSAQGAVIAVDLWKDLPFFAILVLAALQFLSADIYEAAKIDGANHFQIFWKILLPNTKSSMATLGIYTFISAWNNLIWMLLSVRSESKWTVTLGISSICGASVIKQPTWNLIMGVIVIGMIPVLILFFAFQKYFMQSVAATGIK